MKLKTNQGNAPKVIYSTNDNVQVSNTTANRTELKGAAMTEMQESLYAPGKRQK